MPNATPTPGASPAMGYVGLGIQLIGALSAADGAASAAKAQRANLAAKARISRWQASQALMAGQGEEQAAMMQAGTVFHSQRAQLAANGVDLGTGSALDLLASTKVVGTRNAMQIRDNAERQAWTYNTDAALEDAGADAVHPWAEAAPSLLSSAGQVASSWYALSKQK